MVEPWKRNNFHGVNPLTWQYDINWDFDNTHPRRIWMIISMFYTPEHANKCKRSIIINNHSWIINQISYIIIATINFKGESFDFLGFLKNWEWYTTTKKIKKWCTYIRTDNSSHCKRDGQDKPVNKQIKMCYNSFNYEYSWCQLSKGFGTRTQG